MTIGNGYITGIFGATTLITSELRGGNTSATNTLNVTSNLTINTSSVFTLGNSIINSSSVSTTTFIGSFASPFVIGNTSIFDVNTTTTGTSAQLIDSFTFITYRSSEYFISIKDNNANNYQTTKLIVIQDGGSAYATEYDTIYTNTSMGVLTANANTTAVTLYFTPVSSNTTVKMSRISLSI